MVVVEVGGLVIDSDFVPKVPEDEEVLCGEGEDQNGEGHAGDGGAFDVSCEKCET